jgi:hypothetical protein
VNILNLIFVTKDERLPPTYEAISEDSISVFPKLMYG